MKNFLPFWKTTPLKSFKRRNSVKVSVSISGPATRSDISMISKRANELGSFGFDVEVLGGGIT